MAENEYKNIKFTLENGVAHMILARHDIRNAYSERDFTDEILDVLAKVQVHPDARVFVMSAEGSAFSAGGNIKDMKDKKGIFGGGTAGVRRGYIEGIQRIPKALYGLDIPSISAVQGPAIGAGCDLALYCDITICSTEAKFGETFINVGIIPGDGGAWILPRRVGMQRAAELTFTGRIVEGTEAAEIGLALECVEPDQLLPRTLELAETIAGRPPITARMLKTLFRQSLSAHLTDFLDNCASIQAICHSTDDHLEAVTSMLEKRSPTFHGK
ncbi:MAG: enoyl-CoA hydratase [Rhodospirillaceae bacterium]|nr:enoyl-CoA hydratase [Rhodospirillaceae bacterium]|tara:strand:- start:2554 stop:3366 length:813 start_codon:yes stop_codon:yes gene_type:complete